MARKSNKWSLSPNILSLCIIKISRVRYCVVYPPSHKKALQEGRNRRLQRNRHAQLSLTRLWWNRFTGFYIKKSESRPCKWESRWWEAKAKSFDSATCLNVSFSYINNGEPNKWMAWIVRRNMALVPYKSYAACNLPKMKAIEFSNLS